MNQRAILSTKTSKFSECSKPFSVGIVSIVFLCAVFVAKADEQKSASRLDWLPYDQLTLEQQKATRGICAGAYVHPPFINRVYGQTTEVLADQAEYQQNGDIILEGRVSANSEKMRIFSDKAKLSNDRSQLTTQGNIVVRQPNALILGDEGLFNQQSQQMDIKNAEYLIYANHFRGKAGRLQHTDTGLVVIEDGYYTSCSPNDNSWRLVGSEIELNNGTGFGTATHARLELGGVPVFYWPYLKFPIDSRRHTGLLYPSISLGSEGVDEYGQPLYLNLAPNYDATISPYWYRNRGTLLNTELRYLLPSDHFGTFNYGFLDKDPLLNDKRRELVSFQGGGHIAPSWIYKVDYSKVSDDDYMRSFESDFDSANTTKLNQLAETQYSTAHWTYLARVQGFQELNDQLTDAQRVYYKLPELQANAAYSADAWRWGSDNQTVRFYKPITDDSAQAGSVSATGAINWGTGLQAQRTHIAPFIGYRQDWLWGFIEGKVKAGFSQYQLTGQPDEVAATQQSLVPTYSLDSGLFFERDFSLFDQSYVQTLEPRMLMVYSPAVEQASQPLFDTTEYDFDNNQLFRDSRFAGLDRQGDLQKVALGITSRFIDDSSGRELLTLSLGQALYLKNRTVTLSSTPYSDNTQLGYQHTRPVSPLVGAVTYDPLSWLTLSASRQWNTDRSAFALERQEEKITATHPSGISFLLRHTKNYSGCALTDDCADGVKKPFDETGDFGLTAPLTDQWRMFAIARRDFVKGDYKEAIAGLEYESCCWMIRIAKHQYYTDDDNSKPDAFQNKTRLQLVLKGFGGIGKKEPYTRSKEFIPGYNPLFN
ncbi:LPS-assembly protein [Oceanospirillum multiglobuliferum]|nr:LPS-assembly protein [Oceanospirillum multiglobuliferum]